MGARQYCSVGVIVPARDEADTIEACIAAVRRACRRSYARESCWVVVVADSCTDSTAERARRGVRSHGEVLECRLASVGAARRLGTTRVLRRLQSCAPQDIWLANTDADSLVPGNWLERQLEYRAGGYQGVAGTVTIPRLMLGARDVRNHVMADYRVHADGSHPHVHGANLGVRADAYMAVGGWYDRRLAEDHCLWGRLRGGRWRLIAASDLAVQTSARLQGRAAGGFAATLAAKIEALYA